MVRIQGGIETYHHRSLQFVNEAGKDPWPADEPGAPVAKASVLLNVMAEHETICNVGFDGRVELMKGKTAEDVNKIIALILARQSFK